MNLKTKNKIYFIGIGGIGMSALARYMLAHGKEVSGYDKTKTALTQTLEELGIDVSYNEDLRKVNSPYYNPKETLVVYTPAIPKTHTELVFFKTNNYDVCKRSELLGIITEETFCLAVAGTHGKTTTTSILGHLLYSCEIPVTAFLGGISQNYNSNLIINGTDVTVVEADEFDRSFLTLSPNMACITSIDADHLDIYGDASELKRAFESFSKCIKPNGKLFVKNGLPIKGITYGVDDDSDYTAKNIKIKNGCYVFDLKTPIQTHKDFKLGLPGRHNLSNAIIALAMAAEYGCPLKQLAKALALYKGVKRRFTYHIKTNSFVFIDDYAHHPEEINAVHEAVREMYPGKKVMVIFQPHLYSRTQDFVNEFAESLSKFDQIFLLEIYPARELPIEGVNSEWLLKKINNPNKRLIQKSEIIDHINNNDVDVLLTIGAGDIGDEVEHIKKGLAHAN
ncbi:UDP-N-acetylmuramate--L-alanine ligase [Winogradskyella alexanderae]|uniref:UDP-N-acetylmuramate--L-alanine ligase n=1 Tax=Winogradskyella alexanderae TaxID=2877123 RepID=A0ABS7XUH7_9FLAO|nr:UDP-N-acetylmuramate--L-alanine ligase [Winogradskyella alexanderae]MCA0132461.1 UDP-N-acetylmuramate--L-alanine ligase [Winogradskyella alexanderae]